MFFSKSVQTLSPGKRFKEGERLTSHQIDTKQRVLIVDDDPLGRKALVSALDHQDYQLILAGSGLEALEKAEQLKPDLILLDMMMPGMDGLEVLKRLRANSALSEIPVVMVTALDDRESKLASLRAGADDFIQKPFDRTEIRVRVGNIIRLNRYRRLIQERERFRYLFDLDPHGIILFRNGEVLGMNPAADAILLDLPGADPLHKLEQLHHEDSQVTLREHLQKETASKPSALPGLFSVAAEKGATRWFEVLCCPFPPEGPRGLQLHIRDVTEKKFLETQFRQSQKLESLGRLAGGVAHDFNNVLTVIRGYSESLLEGDLPDSSIRNKIEQIDHAASKASNLTRQLLAFSRQQSLNLRVVKLNQIAQDMETMMERAKNVGVNLRFDLAPDLRNARVDSGQMEQILMNLTINASDALADQAGGEIVLSTRNIDLTSTLEGFPDFVPPGKYCLLSLRDNGSGMSGETITRIFEPFFTTKPAGKGTGLGLATVLGIVKQSQGYLQVRSVLGEGTQFELYFPASAEKVDVKAGPKNPSASFDTSGTVLLVEDEETVLSLLLQFLRGKGFHVLDAPSGEEALKVASAHGGAIDLVMTDAIMPGMTGSELIHRLGQDRPNMRVILMSGFSPEDLELPTLADARILLLQKPFTMVALNQLLALLLNDQPGVTG
ncbi:MAG: response regulator [Gemmataceae bacterium]